MGQIHQGKKSKGEIPYRLLGRTKEKVSIVGLGGYHIGIQKEEQESIRFIRTAGWPVAMLRRTVVITKRGDGLGARTARMESLGGDFFVEGAGAKASRIRLQRLRVFSKS